MQRRRVPLIIHTNNSHRGQHAARHAASSRRGEDAELSGARHLGDTQRHSTDRGASKLAAQGLRPRLLRRDERKSRPTPRAPPQRFARSRASRDHRETGSDSEAARRRGDRGEIGGGAVIGEGGGGDRGEIGGGAVIGEKRSALTTSSSVVISGHQRSSVVISGHKWS